MRCLVIVFVLFCFSCVKDGAISPREAFDVFVNSMENSDLAMFKTIQSKDSLKFFEDIAGKLSQNNTAQRNYISTRYAISDFPADVDYVMEFFLLSEKDGNLIKSLKSGIESINRVDNRAVIVTNLGTQVVLVKENFHWKVNLRGL